MTDDDGIPMGFEVSPHALHDIDGAMTSTGAADGHRQVRAVVGFEIRHPSLEEFLQAFDAAQLEDPSILPEEVPASTGEQVAPAPTEAVDV